MRGGAGGRKTDDNRSGELIMNDSCASLFGSGTCHVTDFGNILIFTKIYKGQ
jgi:hypothetical protein